MILHFKLYLLIKSNYQLPFHTLSSFLALTKHWEAILVIQPFEKWTMINQKVVP